MPDILNETFRQLDPMFFVALAGFAVLAALNLFISGRSSRGSRRRQPYIKGTGLARLSVVGDEPTGMPISLHDPRTQMEYIAKADFETCPLLNKEEARLLPILERAAAAAGQKHRVMAQTSMGEVLRPRKNGIDKETVDLAFRSINSKRLDFAIINRSGHLVCAIEYQGTGHYHRNTFMRDAVKKEVLRKAGVRFIEIEKGFDAKTLENDVLKAIGGGMSASPDQRSEPPLRGPEKP